MHEFYPVQLQPKTDFTYLDGQHAQQLIQQQRDAGDYNTEEKI